MLTPASTNAGWLPLSFDCKAMTAVCRVFIELFDEEMISGQKYIVQPCRKAHTLSAMIDGRTTGRTILKRKRRCPQPSIKAA